MNSSKFYFPILFIITVILTSGCANKSANRDNNTAHEEYKVLHAKGFHVKKYTEYTEVTVVNPWDTTKILQNYILVRKGERLPNNLPKGIVIRTPLEKVIAYNTTHCSTLKELNSIGIVKGVGQPQYIKAREIREGIKNGTVLDIGKEIDPDIEKIIMLSPDAIFAAPVTGQTYGNIEITKIPLIETPDYTEPHPLGRAEWIRFYSLFIDKEELADSLYNITVQNYNNIKEMTANATIHPSVLMDTRYMGSWNMPGGKSFMANMLADAGGRYPWADDESTSFMPLAFEAVLDKAGDADVWLIRYFDSNDMTYQSLEREYKPYSYFEAFKKRNIYGCNTTYANFYEDLPIHPDYILKDFAAIFHPDLFTNYTLKYYKKLE